MSGEPGRVRTVADAGAEAVALFRRIDVERAENPTAHPGIQELAGVLRVGIRSALLAVPFVIAMGFWFESVFYSWIGIVALILVLMRTTRDDRQQGVHDKIADIELYSTDVRA